MPPELTSEAWVQIRYDYERTERPIEDICAEHGISSGTLRDRMRRWAGRGGACRTGAEPQRT